jgi:hypothetical protein
MAATDKAGLPKKTDGRARLDEVEETLLGVGRSG